MSHITPRLSALLPLLVALTPVPAMGDVRCAGRHWLLRPLPAACLEDIDTDRPHMTDTPHTVPAGHLQLEVGLVTFGAGRAGGALPRRIDFFDLLLKVGLVDHVDLQLGVSAFNVTASPDGEQVEAARSLYWRLKLHIYGSDAEPLALTLAPVLLTPIRAGASVEGGGMLLLSTHLPGKLDVEVNFSALRRQREGAYRWIMIPSLAVTRTLFRSLAGFVEIYGEAFARDAIRWSGLFNLGLLYGLTPGVQLDGGVRIGLTELDPPYALFGGISVRR